ncbi:MAG: hypothetical protein NVS2B4_07400 [Ramlibacter sp.]
MLASAATQVQRHSPATASLAASPVIDGLQINADSALDPGSILDIAVRGTPHGRASVRLPGGPMVALREREPGLYTGRYTVRQRDRIDASSPLRATVAQGSRSAIASYRFPPSFRVPEVAAASSAPPLSPATAAAPPAPEPTVAPGAAPAMAAATGLVLKVTAPSQPAVLDAGTGLLVEGRTAPNAMVRARIDAVPAAAPGRSAVARIVMEETVQADADGRFRITLGPQRELPGTQLQIGLRASQGDQVTPEQRLVVRLGRSQG